MSITDTHIESVIRCHFPSVTINTCERVAGGYSKHTYHLVLDNTSCIFQIDTSPVDHLPTPAIHGMRYLYPGGIENYLRVKDVIEEMNIRVPRLLFMDTSCKHIPYPCFLSEYIDTDCYSGIEHYRQNGTLDDFLFGFGASLGKLKCCQRSYPGALSCDKKTFDPIPTVTGITCNLIERSTGNACICKHKDAIKRTLRNLTEKISTRDEYYLIHSDFKPDNFRFDAEGNVYWVDIESIQYFDVEYEISQFCIPEFIATNTDIFYKGYFSTCDAAIDDNRLLLYKIFRCIAQITHCSDTKVPKYSKEPVDAIIASNTSTLETLLQSFDRRKMVP